MQDLSFCESPGKREQKRVWSCPLFLDPRCMYLVFAHPCGYETSSE